MVTDSPGWNARNGAASCVYDDKLWIMGGVCPASYLNDVWYSSDGVSWECATDSAPWSARTAHEAVAYDGKLWMIGGGAWVVGFETENDVWSTENGTDWTEVTESAEWPPRMGHEFLVYNNKMWVIGGGNYSGTVHNDAWYSTDGVNWTSSTTSAPWQGRESHSTAVMNGKIWVIAGCTASGTRLNDVWSMTTVGITEESELPIQTLGLSISPCPSVSSVTISYDLMASSTVTISIYDITGREVYRTPDSFENSGNHSFFWDGNSGGHKIDKGIYFCRVESDSATETKTIVLI